MSAKRKNRRQMVVEEDLDSATPVAYVVKESEEQPADEQPIELVLTLQESYAFVDTGADIEHRQTSKRQRSWVADTRIAPAVKGFMMPKGLKARIGGNLELELPPGLTMVLGGSGSGKTTLTQQLVRQNDFEYVSFGEPLSQGTLNLTADGHGILCQSEAGLAHRLARHIIAGEKKAIVVDSLRYLFYSPSGATGKGGVNMTLFADLTFLDFVCTATNSVVVIVVNPLSTDEMVLASIREAASGSVSGLLELQAGRRATYTARGVNNRQSRVINIPNLLDPQKVDERQRVEVAESAIATDLTFLTR